MEKHLVYKIVRFKFGNQFLLAQKTLFIKRESGINAIVGYRSINQIVIVREASLRTVCMHKVHPVFSGRVVK